MKNIKVLRLAAVLTFMAVSLCACMKNAPIDNVSSEEEPTTAAEATEAGTANTQNDNSTDDEKAGTASIDFLFAGDNLVHDTIYNQASRNAGGNGYDFSETYAGIKDYISRADFAVLNQETLVTDEYGPSNYPTFASPTALGDYMVEIGFDAMSISNNHVLDYGVDGLLSSLDYWSTKHPDTVVYGAYKDEADQENIRVKEINGIKVAFLGFPEHTNGNLLPAENDGCITYLEQTDKVEKMVRKADEIADVVIVSPHFGTEILNEVSDFQHDMAKKLTEWGADIIVGCQPHTVQKCDWVTADNGNKAFCYYCLGNMVSAMATCQTSVGILGELTVNYNFDTDTLTIENPRAVPIVTHISGLYQWSVFVYPYSQYTEELASQSQVEDMSMENLKYYFSFIPEEYLSLE